MDKVGNRMDVPLNKVLSARGTLIVGGETYRAYCIFLQGQWQEARDLLIREHFAIYFAARRNVTTDKIVTEIYAALGLEKPGDYMASHQGIVTQAVEQRVDVYLAQLERFRQGGYVETDVIRMSPRGTDYIMQSCGENKVAALAALGHVVMPGVVVN